MTSGVGEVSSGLEADVASIKQDVEQILPALVEALKRNRYFDEMERQLRRAERVAEAWREWPLVVGVHDVIIALRASDTDPQIVEQLLDVLYRSAGVEEFGFVGEQVDPTQVEISESAGAGNHITVRESQRPGLRIGHQPLRKAIVSVIREEGQS